MFLVGGFGETTDATEKTQTICDQVKSKVEEKTQKTYEEFSAVQYRSQVVHGINYLIKVHVGANSYLHLKVSESFTSEGGELVLHGVQEAQVKDSPIEPF